MNPQVYYDYAGNIALPRHSNCYFDYLGHQYRQMPEDEKLADLGFVLYKGLSLKTTIYKHKIDKDPNILDALLDTLIQHIIYLRTGQYIDGAIDFIIRNNLSEPEIINLLSDELKLRYNHFDHKVEIGWVNVNELYERIKPSKEEFKSWFITAKQTKEFMTLRKI